MTIEEKAVECYEKNRALKPKYHIDEEAWMDWFEEGYKCAQEEQPRIKPLVFDGETAHTSVATYDVYRDDEDHMVHVDIDNCHEGVFDYREDAIQYCKEHYESLIKQCLISEE